MFMSQEKTQQASITARRNMESSPFGEERRKVFLPALPSALDVFQTTTSPLWKAEMPREQSQTASQGETPPGFPQPSHSSSTQQAWHCHCCLAHRLANLVIYGSRENSEQRRKLLLATQPVFKRRLHRGCFLFPFL